MANYNESRIYKIWCNLEGIDEIYIGSSARFIERCKLHESDCNNINSPRYSYKLYQYIRNNGGFQNFKIHVIQEFPCENRTALNIREEYWKKELQPTLNTNRAHLSKNELRDCHNKAVKKHYTNNKTHIRSKAKQVIQCSHCDKTHTKENKSHHQKTKYCKNYKSTTSESSSESIINSESQSE